MATLNLIQHFEVTLADNTVLKIGSKVTPLTLTLTNGTRYDTLVVVADNYGAETLWTTGGGGMDTFEVALVYSDVDVWLELRNEQATDEFALVQIQGGVWHVLSTDNMGGYQTMTRIDGAVLADNTDYGQIDNITAHRDVAAAAGAATVHLILLG